MSRTTQTTLALLLVMAISWCDAFAQSASDSSLKSVRLPIIELNAGYGFLLSDNGFTTGLGGSNAQLNYQLSLNQPILPYLSAGINLGTSTFSDDRMLDDETNVNFRSVVFSQDLSVYYEMSHLFQSKDPRFKSIQPYVGFGAGMVSFRSKGDLKDENGTSYHFWSDGSIRDLAENDPNSEAAVLVMRDRSFESDLRDADLDGFGRYDQLAFRLPFELGLRYQFTKNIGVNLKVRYHMNFTDLIDNVTVASTGTRAGTVGNDHHLTTSIGISAFLGRHTKTPPKPTPKPALAAEEPASEETDDESPVDTSNTEASELGDIETTQTEKAEIADSTRTETEKSDESSEDSATEVQEPVAEAETKMENGESAKAESSDEAKAMEESESTSTESAESVDETLPDSEIEEMASDAETESQVKEAVSKESGSAETGVSEEKEDESTATTASQTSEEEEVTPENGTSKEVDIMEVIEGLDNTEPKEAGEYHWADINKDRYISADEVLHFIDLLFDGDSEYTVPMIHSLIEYYFDQD